MNAHNAPNPRAIPAICSFFGSSAVTKRFDFFNFLTPWIIITVVVLVLNFLQTLRMFAMNNVDMGLVHILSGLLLSYFLICIHSLEKKIEEDKAEPRKYHASNENTFNKV